MRSAKTLESGKTEHNLANAEDYDFVAENLGGENNLRKKYPNLYKIMQHTKEKSKEQINNQMDVFKKITANADPYIYGLRNSNKIRTINYDSHTTLQTSSSSNVIAETPTLVIIGELTDVTNNKSIDGFAVYENNSHHLFGEIVQSSNKLISSKRREFRATSTFTKIAYDENGKEVIVSETLVSDSVKIESSSTLVKELKVIDPTPVKHQGANETVIYYNNRKGIGCDYYFNNVKIGTDEVDMYIPFSGSVEFNSGFLPDYVDKNRDFKLQIENINNGVAEFNTSHWKEIDWTVNGSILSWKFPDCWHSVLKRNNLVAANNVNFYCKMYVVTKPGTTVPIVIQSDGEEHGDPSYKKIKPLRIEWGCFAKSTKIKMADNTIKLIEEIKIGENVLTMDGKTARVKNIITGTEEKMVCIKTSRGNTILITSDHPVMTNEGMLRANELTAGNIISMEYGNDSVEWLFYQEYNDRVFSLELDEKSVLIANGFYAGDFASQQEPKLDKPANKKVKIEAFQEEIADLISKMNKKQEG